MFENEDAFMRQLRDYLVDCEEYDILPHYIEDQSTRSHVSLQKSDSALAICSCLVRRFYTAIVKRPLNSLTDKVLVFLVLVNPNTVSFWNCRRRALLSGRIRPAYELWLTKLVLGTHPRSNETLFHREWVVKTFHSTNQRILLDELNVCDHIAHRYRSHYAVWQYRRFLIQQLESKQVSLDLYAVEKWLQSHPTDSSGWNYLGFVLQRLFNQSTYDQCRMRELLCVRLRNINQTLELYPERECLWIFKRTILCHLWHLDKPRSVLYSTDQTDSAYAIAGHLLELFDKHEHDMRSFRSVTALLNFCHFHGLCCNPENLQWSDLLQLLHVFFLLRVTLEGRSGSPSQSENKLMRLL